jgi:Glycosyltransferase family 87/Malate synthase
VAINNLMEDAATAAISRSQIWQWKTPRSHHPAGVRPLEVSHRSTRSIAAVIVAVALAAVAASPATAAETTTTATSPAAGLPPVNDLSPDIYPAQSRDERPPTFTTTAGQAIQNADRTRAVQDARRSHPHLVARAFISPLPLLTGRFYHWEVFYSADGERQVEVDVGPDGRVLEVQTAPDVGWGILRGYPGVLGGRLNAPYIWLPLCFLFILPFIDPRRLKRLIHLDLLVLLSFGVSQWYFTRGQPDASVRLFYPPLIYVACRALYAAFAPRRRSGPLVPYAPTRLLAVGAVLLLLLRAGFGVTESHILDISVAGVIGADRIEHGLPLYVDNDYHGDTYGPVNYLMYVPFELVSPYKQGQPVDSAAQDTTILFDTLTVLGLFLLGRRLRAGPAGTRLGVTLAYAWAAFPYTALVIASNTNDALVPLFVIYALILLRSPPLRGAFAALGTMAKFAPAAVAPVLIAGRSRLTLRSALLGGGVYVLICAALVWAFLPDGGVREFWNTTIGFQLQRTSPLSIWGRVPSLDSVRPIFSLLAVILIAASAFVPRQRSAGQVAAWCAAIFAAIQLPSRYWLYFYIVWFAPFLFVALFEEYRDLGPSDQSRLTRDLGKPVRMSQPESVTATKSSMRTPIAPGT